MKNKIFTICFRIMGIVALIACVYLLVGSIQNYIAQHAQKDWPVQTAQVSDISSRVVSSGTTRHNRSRTVYDITYQYVVDGQTYTGNLNSTDKIRMVGDELKIKYNPEAPAESTTTLSPRLSDLLIPMGVGIVFGVIGFFLSGLWAWIRKLRRRSRPEGEELPSEEEEVLPPEEYVSPNGTMEPQIPKGPGMLVLQRVIPLVLVVGMIVIAFFVFSGKDAVTPEHFADVSESKGYTTVDSTEKLQQEWKIGSMLEQSVSLDTGDMHIDFCVMETLDSARNLYHGMNLPVSEGTEVEKNGQNYEHYSIEDDVLYTAKFRVGNTVVYAACTPSHRAEVTELLQAIGYLEE